VVKKQIECGLAWLVLLSTTIRVITEVKILWTRGAQPSKSALNLATSQSARFALVSTSAAYTHGQIVDDELANQSARFALVML